MTDTSNIISKIVLNDAIDSIDVFFEYCPIPIILFDTQWRINKWSKKAQQIFLWDENEVIGKSVSQINFVYEQDVELFQNVINELTISDSCSSKNRNYKKDGSVVVCEWINVRYCNASGETIGYLTFCQDITELEEKKSLLEEIKHYFTTFFDSIPIPVIYLNNNLIIKNSNSSFNKIFQTNSNKLLNINLTELDANSQTTKHKLHQQLINFINSDEFTLVTDATFFISEDNVRDFYVSFTKQLDRNDKLVGIFGFFLDITKINILSRELNESIRLYQNLFQTSSDGIVYVSNDWEIIDANKTFCEMVEMNYYEIKGKTIQAIISSIHTSNLDKEYHFIDELIFLKKDGSKIILNTKIWAKKDFFGKTNGFWMIFRDVTVARELRKQLIETQQRYELAVEGSNDGLWDWDVQQKQLWLSPKLKNMLEIDSECNIYNNSFILQLIHLDDVSFVIETVQQHFSQFLPFAFELRLKSIKNNSYRWYLVKGKIIKDENDLPTRVAGSLQDIHERKILEEKEKVLVSKLIRSNEELQQFAYVASHDLQEPLRMISSFLQLFKSRYFSSLNKEAAEFVNFAIDGSIRMQQMVNDLLSYSRINTRPGKFEPVNMNNLVSKVIDNLKLAIKDKKACIYFNELPENIVCDEGQLFQLFLNLINNALKFSKNEVRPEIVISCDENESEYIFKVKDNGIGIDEQFKDRIFKIFQRLHTRDEFPGNGIGLAICRRIVQRHNGWITFESELNEGTTFIFSISKNIKDELYEL